MEVGKGRGKWGQKETLGRWTHDAVCRWCMVWWTNITPINSFFFKVWKHKIKFLLCTRDWAGYTHISLCHCIPDYYSYTIDEGIESQVSQLAKFHVVGDTQWPLFQVRIYIFKLINTFSYMQKNFWIINGCYYLKKIFESLMVVNGVRRLISFSPYIFLYYQNFQ